MSDAIQLTMDILDACPLPLHTDQTILEARAIDESIFQMAPFAVVFPERAEQVRELVDWAHDYHVPLVARGGGSGIAGQSIGQGLCVDFSKHMNKILEIGETTVVVEPGLVLAALNSELASTHKRFTIDPGSARWATLGGMASTNAAGPRGLKWGCMRDQVLAVRTVLEDGESYLFEERASTLRLDAIAHEYLNDRDTQSAWPKVSKISSGYHLPSLLTPQKRDLGIWIGSEGTLGMMTELKLRIHEIPYQSCMGVFEFASLELALQAISAFMETEPSAIELMDTKVWQKIVATEGLQLKKDVASPFALWVEWENVAPVPAIQLLAKIWNHNEAEVKYWWELRSKATKALHSELGNFKPLRFIEDAVVPLSLLPEFLGQVQDLLGKFGLEAAMFGHVGHGHIHLNPWIDTHKEGFEQIMHDLMHVYHDLVAKFGGALSGEHGDGVLRAFSLARTYPRLYPYFEKIKFAFDEKNIFNPGKKIYHPVFSTLPLKNLQVPWRGATS